MKSIFKNSKKNEGQSQKIKVEVTPVSGVFSLDDFKEFSKMKLSSSKDIQELVLIGSLLLKDTENSLTKLLSEAITFKVSEHFNTNYIITIQDDDVAMIDVVISDSVDESMARMLEKNNQVIRVQMSKHKEKFNE